MAQLSGIGIKPNTSGTLNHFATTPGFTSGVAAEIATSAKPMGHNTRAAQRTACVCNSPSVFMISQPAPSNT